MIHLGHGPCSKCREENDNVLLTGETTQAQDGGTYWRVAPNQMCVTCSHILEWFYGGPIALQFVLEIPAKIPAQDKDT